jgi:hypothetical protein
MTDGSGIPRTPRVGVAAGNVGSSTAAAPDMLGHQHEACVPAPCPMGDGIAW